MSNGASRVAGATTSTQRAVSIRSPPSEPSRASRVTNLRPIMPAAPITRIFNGVSYYSPARSRPRAMTGDLSAAIGFPLPDASLIPSRAASYVTQFDGPTEAKSWPPLFRRILRRWATILNTPVTSCCIDLRCASSPALETTDQQRRRAGRRNEAEEVRRNISGRSQPARPFHAPCLEDGRARGSPATSTRCLFVLENRRFLGAPARRARPRGAGGTDRARPIARDARSSRRFSAGEPVGLRPILR